jgi:NAD(P)-dependent dehydrogenase (short-subunit alcohol dehydrogenase family)
MSTLATPSDGPAGTSTLDDRVALVTGAARGLGAALAAELAGAGMAVMVGDVLADAAEATAGRLRDSGAHVEATWLDVTDQDSAEAAVNETVSRFGRLDVLVNNAGTDITAPFETIEAAAWDRVIDVNLRGPANMARIALPFLAEDGGDIVNITSTAAKRAWPNATAYHASKWGLLGLSHSLHAECRTRGIRVSAIVCGGMRTPFLLERFPELDPERLMEPARVAAAVRWVLGQPRDVAIAELTLVPLTEASWP